MSVWLCLYLVQGELNKVCGLFALSSFSYVFMLQHIGVREVTLIRAHSLETMKSCLPAIKAANPLHGFWAE